LHNDTDFATATVAAGRLPLQLATENMHDVNSGTHTLNNLALKSVVVELCEPVVFRYSILNSGNADGSPDVQKFLANAVLKAGEDYINDALKNAWNPNSTTYVYSASEGGKPLDVLTDTGGGPLFIASLLGAGFIAAAADLLLQVAFADCDGVVAADQVAYQKGRDLQAQIQKDPDQKDKVLLTTDYLGTPAQSTWCGENLSYYRVAWSISPA
jgi:hypothetical protein